MKNTDRPTLVVMRGGGDVATGVAQKLWRGGFALVILEAPTPTTIRRTVSLSEAIFTGRTTVEDLTGVRVNRAEDCAAVIEGGEIPLLVDMSCDSLTILRPGILVDAIIAKRNLGTHRGMAPLTIGLGPGFSAPDVVDGVIETMRGHELGRLITEGAALPNTGTPGLLGGKTGERVMHAPAEGAVRHHSAIGQRVEKGQPVMEVGGVVVPSPLEGTVRGLISEGIEIPKGLKCADVDPRPADEVDVLHISDKARCIGGAVLEACLFLGRKKGLLQCLA